MHLCEINYPWELSSVGMIFFRKYLFRFILPQIARIFTDFLLLGQQLLADEWMCRTHEINQCRVNYRPPLSPPKVGRTGLSAS